MFQTSENLSTSDCEIETDTEEKNKQEALNCVTLLSGKLWLKYDL